MEPPTAPAKRARCGACAGYLNKVQSDDRGAKVSSSDELESLRRRSSASGGVSARLAQFSGKKSEEPAATPVASTTSKFSGMMVGNQAVAQAQADHYGLARADEPPRLADARGGASGSTAASGEGSPVGSPGMVDGRKSSMSVDALKKYREAKQFLETKDVESPTPRGSARGARAGAPPKVDLYS